MTRIPDPTPVPETLDRHLWLGNAAWRPFTDGDGEYREFAARQRGDRPLYGGEEYGFYLPFNRIFVGTKGYMGTGGRGEDVGLLPGTRWAEYELSRPILSRAPEASTAGNHAAHCNDWVRACKGDAPAGSNFAVAGRYTEWLLLGVAAVHYEGKPLWDAEKGEITNVRSCGRRGR
jgi:hypothetical protein